MKGVKHERFRGVFIYEKSTRTTHVYAQGRFTIYVPKEHLATREAPPAIEVVINVPIEDEKDAA